MRTFWKASNWRAFILIRAQPRLLLRTTKVTEVYLPLEKGGTDNGLGSDRARESETFFFTITVFKTSIAQKIVIQLSRFHRDNTKGF